MFLQISVNRAGVISGAYTSTITGDQRPIAGQVDKATSASRGASVTIPKRSSRQALRI